MDCEQPVDGEWRAGAVDFEPFDPVGRRGSDSSAEQVSRKGTRRGKSAGLDRGSLSSAGRHLRNRR
jgi:hypothetical protein